MTPHPLLPETCQAGYVAEGLWTGETLFDLLSGAAAAAPEHPLYPGAEPLSYGEAARAARGLAGGLSRGDVVVAPLVNGWPAAVVSAAAAVAGATLAPLPSRATPAQVARLAAATEAHALAISGRVLARAEWDAAALDRVLGEAPSLRRLWLADEDAAPGWARSRLDSLAGAAAGPPLEARPAVDAGAVGLLLSTGGTTGPAKLVMHSHRGVVYAARQYARSCRLTAADRVLQVGPFGHASGTIFTLYAPILAGATIIPVVPWSADAFCAAAERHAATWSLLSGTHVHDLVALETSQDGRLSTLRGISAGSGADALFAEAERRFGFGIRRMYGLTECLGNSIMPADAPEAQRTTRDGLAFPGTEHVVVAPGTETPVATGEPGELLVRGPSLFAGYHGQPELTAAAITAGGFFRTGDLMTLDAHGFCKYVGRIKDVIRRGGVNIDPLAVERELLTHPSVRDVTVVGVPDERLGERAAAIVVPHHGWQPTLAALNSHLAEREVPLQSRPELLFTVESLPLTEYGKHDKNAVRDLLQGLVAR